MTTLPTGQYGVIYADPPWYFRVRSPKGEGRSATQHYSCMGLDDICALPEQSIAAPDCALFLWITSGKSRDVPSRYSWITEAARPGRSSIGGCPPRTPQRQATRDPNPHRATGRRTVCGIVRTRSSAGVGCMGDEV
jgi:hypothetical protein